LLHAGHRVAVCDQVEDPALAKGLVKREVTRVVTAGTVTEDELLDPKANNHIAAVVCGARGLLGLAWADLSAGTFWAADLTPDRLADELARIAPTECLIAERDGPKLEDAFRAAPPRTVALRPDWTFDPATTREALCKQFGVVTMAGFGFESDHQ